MSNYWLTKEQYLDWQGDHKPQKTLDRVNIRRLLLWIRKNIDNYLESVNNSEEPWEKISDRIKLFVTDLIYELHNRKAYQNYIVQDLMEGNERHITISILPTAMTEYVKLTLVLSNEY